MAALHESRTFCRSSLKAANRSVAEDRCVSGSHVSYAQVTTQISARTRRLQTDWQRAVAADLGRPESLPAHEVLDLPFSRDLLVHDAFDFELLSPPRLLLGRCCCCCGALVAVCICGSGCGRRHVASGGGSRRRAPSCWSTAACSPRRSSRGEGAQGVHRPFPALNNSIVKSYSKSTLFAEFPLQPTVYNHLKCHSCKVRLAVLFKNSTAVLVSR